MNISDYLRTALLNHALDVATYVPPSTVWAALYVVAPTSAGGGTEVAAADYARVATSWNLASLGSTTNSLDIRFPTSGVTLSNWSTVSAIGLRDAPTAGNLLFFGPLSASVALALGTDFLVPASDLTITFS